MFILKKIFTLSLLPPGIFIILLLLGVLFLKKRLKLFMVSLAVLLYLFSIEPTKDLLLLPLENAYRPPAVDTIKAYDAYVVLGGGVYDNAPDIDGKGIPGEDALARIVCAFRLFQLSKKPIIFSGGNIGGRTAESEIAKRLFLSLGVGGSYILPESRSIDTFENARYVKALAEQHRITKIVLITNAYHMKRSKMLFDKHFKEVLPFPVGYKTSQTKYDVFSFLPNANNTAVISIAIKEYLGITFFKLTL